MRKRNKFPPLGAGIIGDLTGYLQKAHACSPYGANIFMPSTEKASLTSQDGPKMIHIRTAEDCRQSYQPAQSRGEKSTDF